MTRFSLACALGVCFTLSACWASRASEHAGYVMAGLDEQRLSRVAILPILNQSTWSLAPDYMHEAVVRVLAGEKRYDVAPRSMVNAQLSRGGGGSFWTKLLEARNMAGPWRPEGNSDEYTALGRLATDLNADGVLGVTIVSYFQSVEQKPTTNRDGQVYYASFPTTVIRVRGFLWGARAKAIVWRDSFTERYYHEPGADGNGRPERIAEITAHELFARLPANTWNPAPMATPTPVPGPVLSFRPFPYPADPQER